MKSDGKCDTCYPGNDVVEGTCISCSQKFENCHQCNDDHSACIGC